MTFTDLTAASFQPRVQDTFTVSTPAAALPLVLTEVQELGSAGINRSPFSLQFDGPLRPILPQAIYQLENPTMGALEIFLVPLGPRGGSMRYEAVFT
jgi:hypothetical protein